MTKPTLKVVKFKSHRDRSIKSSIKVLKHALRQAKKGKITSVGIAVVRPNGSVNASRSDTDDVGRLLGAISLLNYRTIQATEKDD